MAPRLGLGGGVTANPASGLFTSPYLLDNFPAHRAYSTRKVSSSYTGYCMKVRESGNNYTADVAFDNTGVITGNSLVYNKSNSSAGGPTLADFCGSNEGHVHTWYDQSGNASNATDTLGAFASAANQPKIWSSNNLVQNGNGPVYASVLFDAGDRLNINPSGLSLGSTSAFAVVDFVPALSSGASETPFFLSYNTYYWYGLFITNHVQYFYYDNGANGFQTMIDYGSYSDVVRLYSLHGSNTRENTTLNVNGTVTTTSSTGNDTDAFQSSGTNTGMGNVFGYDFIGHISELIVFNTDQLDNDSAIRENINRDFGVH